MKKKILVSLMIVVVLLVAYFYNETPITENIAIESTEIIDEEAEEIPIIEEIENIEKLEDIPAVFEDVTVIKDEEEIEILDEITQEVVAESDVLTCTLLVSCEVLLEKMEVLDAEKRELIPENGWIYSASEVVFYEGESVFNVLQREMKSNQIHLEFVNTPLYNSTYIEGINNLYEFDAGELSGWMYQVNGTFPSYGSSQYILEDGDTIWWQYTCDLGADLGEKYMIQGKEDEQ